MAEGGVTDLGGGGGGGGGAGGRGDSDDLPVTLVKYNNPVLVIKHPEKTPEQKVADYGEPITIYNWFLHLNYSSKWIRMVDRQPRVE